MDDNLIIRLAYSDDVPAMAKLLSELFAIEDDFTIDGEKQSHGLELLLQSPQSVILVAEMQNGVVGMLSLQRMISTAIGEYVGIIEDVVVSEFHRGYGIGTKLLETAIDEAERREWGRLALGVDLRNTKAIAFYQKYGFETSNMGLMYRIA
ncbi:MAG: GNAT family N-acetyltransferase [Sulfuricurvum sp.]|uniref:GNAT family N-acetyltransferase n=1 Tax=Sulfuricurvum sp. TaxID=2025608 RepID=UPI002636FD91|nr:GNAT family N-acetyltransferase [Sulfuricurvum sp.]MDD5158727.1 GNAT family N-acetyltransferase [Sulfuricurvum sp.]MDD5160207.1 GNAT family N-acetyltransferase [Sulfuricurvum sp.]